MGYTKRFRLWNIPCSCLQIVFNLLFSSCFTLTNVPCPWIWVAKWWHVKALIVYHCSQKAITWWSQTFLYRLKRLDYAHILSPNIHLYKSSSKERKKERERNDKADMNGSYIKVVSKTYLAIFSHLWRSAVEQNLTKATTDSVVQAWEKVWLNEYVFQTLINLEFLNIFSVIGLLESLILYLR